MNVGIYGTGAIVESLGELTTRAGIAHRATDDAAELADVAFILEALDEALDVKRAAVSALAAANPRAPIATVTGVCPVGAIAAAAPDPSRVAGLHFLRAPDLVTVAEVVRARQTSDATYAAVVQFAENAGLQVAESADRPGFLSLRLLVPYLNDVIECLDSGLASPEDLDLAVELGLGYPKGPLMVLDEIGLDVHLRRAEALSAQLSDPHLAPPPLLARMVDAGEHGSAVGRGFRTTEETA